MRTLLSGAVLAVLVACGGGGSSAGAPPPPAVHVEVVPATWSIYAGSSYRFTATVTGTMDQRVTWDLVEASAWVSVGPDGMATAGPGAQGTFHVRATSVADASARGVATLLVQPVPATISVVPDYALLHAGDSLTLAATVTGSADTGVIWSVAQELPGASLSPGGVITTSAGTVGRLRVVATSVANPAVTATVEIDVESGVGVWLAPAAATLRAGQSLPLAAVATGSTDHDVTWAVQETGGGTVTGTGLYAAPPTPGTYHVVATSTADPTRTATAAITVKPALEVIVSPSSAAVVLGHRQQFTASAGGVPTTAVWWSVLEGPSCGTIDASGSYVAAGTGTCHVVAATTDAPSVSGIAAVEVVSAIEIAPATLSVVAGASATFVATGGDVPGRGVTWHIVELPFLGGSSSTDGTSVRWQVQAPTEPGTYHVRAKTSVSPVQEAEAILTVTVRPTHVVAGAVSGVTGPLTLMLNGSPQSVLAVAGNGAFQFSVGAPEGWPFVIDMPATSGGEPCLLVNGAGNVLASDITSEVACGAFPLLTVAVRASPPWRVPFPTVDAVRRRSGGALFAGYAGDPLFTTFVAATDGSGQLDPSFGNGGVATVAWNEVCSDQSVNWFIPVDAVAEQPDGKILVAGALYAIPGCGQSTNGLAVLRLNVDGTVDTGFGAAGRAGVDVFGLKTQALARAIKVRPDGRIVAGGWADNGLTKVPIVVGLLPSGARDPDFGASGVVDLSAVASLGQVDALAVDALGRLLVGGTWLDSSARPHGFLVRLDITGALDPAFSAPAASTLTVGVADLVALPSGGAVVLGYNQSTDVLMRVSSAGGFDSGFGTHSVAGSLLSASSDPACVVIPDSPFSAAGGRNGRQFSIHVDSAGNIGVAVTCQLTATGVRTPGRIFSMRYSATGKVDLGHGIAGIASYGVPENSLPGYNVTVGGGFASSIAGWDDAGGLQVMTTGVIYRVPLN